MDWISQWINPWIVIAVFAFLQTYLSMRKKFFFGLIIPIILLCDIIFVATLTSIYYNPMTTSFPLDGLILINTMGDIIALFIYMIIFFICLYLKKKRTK
jgi:hypothetical protein